MTRCGVVALVGEPNVGKSSLLNALVETKLAIVSSKPQSTRQSVSGVLTRGDTQLILVDPPGLLDPGYALQEVMLETALETIRGAHVVVHLIMLRDFPGPLLSEHPQVALRSSQPFLKVYTKADLVAPKARPEIPNPDLAISARSREGMDELIARLVSLMPEGPFRHDPEDIAVEPLRFFAAEFVREAAFELLHDELPYSVHVEIDEFREADDPVYIRAVVYVERESQKPVLVGAGGRQIRDIGMRARPQIEVLLGRPVFLDLWVKVLPKWRRRPNLLRRLRLSS